MQKPIEIDVIVGGGGVAGAAATAAMQQLGYKVMLVEPGLNDDRRLAGEVFHPPGVAGLAELGLLNAVRCEPATTLNGFSVSLYDDHILLPYDKVPAHRTAGLCLAHGLIRRRMLQTVKALPNVTVLGARIVDIDQTKSSGVGVRVADGRTATEYRCRLLIAADGAQCRIGRMAGIAVYRRRISTVFGYRLTAKNLPQEDYGHVFLGGRTPILVYPIGAGNVRILFDLPYDSTCRPDFSDCLRLAAVLPLNLRREVEHALNTQSRMAVLTYATGADRTVQGRVVLVGDAGGSCHPLTATGMTMCIRDAIMLREALTERPEELPQALQFYQQRRLWPQATRLALAEALRDAFCGESPEVRVVQRGILTYWRESAAGRVATLALLSTADDRPRALLGQFVVVMVRCFVGHLAKRSPDRVGTLRVASAILRSLIRQVRQVGRHLTPALKLRTLSRPEQKSAGSLVEHDTL